MPWLNQPYTVGVWTVKPGNEQEFIDEWNSFARWTSESNISPYPGILLQDGANPLRFFSFGAWPDDRTIQAWRSTPEFQAFAEKARVLCEAFQPHTMRLVASTEEDLAVR